MTRIAYITKLDFSTAKAHAHTIAKTCEALALVPGVEFVLVSTDGSLKSDEAKAAFFARQGVSRPFRIESLGSLGWRRYADSPIRFRFAALVAQFSLSTWLIRNRKHIDIAYGRDHLLPLPLLVGKYLLGIPFVFESHFVLTKRLGQRLTEFLIRRAAGIVAITGALADYYRPVNPRVIVSYCAAAEPEKYADVSREQIEEKRSKLGAREGDLLLGYTGNMRETGNGDSYGIEDIIRALPLLPERVRFAGVGKKPGETLPVEALAGELGLGDRAQFFPWVPRGDIAAYALAADILVIPASGAKIGNSPTKTFEYLASGRPIVAADTQPIAEVLHDGENALVVDYAKPEAWSHAIERLMNDAAFASSLATRALADSALYRWQKRGADIADFIRNIA